MGVYLGAWVPISPYFGHTEGLGPILVVNRKISERQRSGASALGIKSAPFVTSYTPPCSC